MALQNFVDKVGPVVSAAWLNMVDVLATTVFGNAGDPVSARSALFADNPLEISNGGTGLRTAPPSAYTLIVKPGNTSRSSTVVPANDPDLTVSLAPGTYAFSFSLGVNQAAGGSIGFNANVNFTGSISASNPLYVLEGQNNGSPFFSAFSATIGSVQTAVNFSLGVIATFNIPVMSRGILIATGSGTLSLAWAQNTSSASATTVVTNSSMLVTKIA